MYRRGIQEGQYAKLKEYCIPIDDAENLICLQYHQGEAVLLEGMPMEYIFLVVKGKAKVCVSTENGKDLLLCWYVSNGIIGDVELMTHSYEATTSIITISEFECIGIPYQAYAKKLRENADFLNKIGCELSKKLIRTTMNCKSAALYTAEVRLCACLLEIEDDGKVREPLTELASAVGISYRHMQRIVKQLCDAKVIQKSQGSYKILNQEYLKRKVPEMYLW